MTTHQNHRGRHGGQGLIEIIGMLVVFTILICMMTSISAYLYVQHALTTVAREGARVASLNSDLADAANQSSAEDEIKSYVQNAMMQMTGQSLEADSIDVTPPDAAGTSGERTVTVAINYNMDNPVPIDSFLSAFPNTDGNHFSTIPVFSTATMRYEE
ncbi:MAG: TadE/TadG family type IV pilus assembly protein [Candidatus Melainabacteria bacterium]